MTLTYSVSVARPVELGAGALHAFGGADPGPAGGDGPVHHLPHGRRDRDLPQVALWCSAGCGLLAQEVSVGLGTCMVGNVTSLHVIASCSDVADVCVAPRTCCYSKRMWKRLAHSPQIDFSHRKATSGANACNTP